jgi:MFS family permease
VLALRILFLLGGAFIGTFMPFVAVILDSRGFDPAEIGLVAAGGSIAFAVSVPIWGHLADVRLGRAGALRLAAFASGVALIGFGLPWPLIVLTLMYLGYAATESAVGPLNDAVAVNALRRPEREYPAIRLLTSLAFATVAIACGFLYDRTGYWPSTLLFAILAFALAFAAGWVPDRPRADLHAYGTRGGRGGAFRVAFAVQPRMPGVLLAIMLAYLGIIGGFTFLSLRIVELGGSPSDVALSAGISALAEVPGMILAGRIANRLGIRTLFAGGALVYALCTASWAVLADPLAIVATRAVTGFAFAAIWIAAVLTIQRLLPDRLQGTGQGLYQTTAFGVAAVVANLAGGLLIGSIGTTGFFAILSIVGLSAVLVGWLVLPPRREVRQTWPGEEGPPDDAPLRPAAA